MLSTEPCADAVHKLRPARGVGDLSSSSPGSHLTVISRAHFQLMNLSRRQLLTALPSPARCAACARAKRYDYRIGFEDVHGRIGETLDGSFTTPGRNRPVSFVFTGDTAGQGYGINPELGGMIAYRAMHDTRPDFFLHSGDNIYADGPIAAELKVADGTIWKNVVTEEVSKVAETLAEYRGRYKYNLLDDNIKALYADVPIIGQWDDHETHNNWYPGQILTDARYTEKRIDVLAARARQAWQEYQPIAQLSDGSTGFEPARIYRKITRGPQLDV